MNNLNQPEKKVQDKLYKYANIVMHAKIDGSAKALLWFYAYVFNWEKRHPSFWPQRKICALTGMAPSTYHKKRKYLEELGWITVFNRGFENSCLVSVKVGVNDPEYETMSWAKWHPENERVARQASLAQFLIDSSHVLESDDASRESRNSVEHQDNSDTNWIDLEEAIW
jgi:hypothetical protein